MDREKTHVKRLLGENFQSNYGLNELDPLVINQGDATVYKKIVFNSWCYFKNAVILDKLSYETADGLPIFCKISEIFVLKAKLYVVLTTMSTIQFDSHFHCFEVKPTQSKKK